MQTGERMEASQPTSTRSSPVQANPHRGIEWRVANQAVHAGLPVKPAIGIQTAHKDRCGLEPRRLPRRLVNDRRCGWAER